MEGKVCFKCNKFLPFSQFYKHSQMSDGHLNKCKECTKRDTKENRERRQDYYNAYDRNRAKLPHRREDVRERQKQNKQSHNLANRDYAQKYPDRRKCQCAVSKALKAGRISRLHCFICGSSEVEAHHAYYDLTAPLDVVWLCIEHHKECHRKYDHEEDAKLLATATKGSRYD